MVARFELPKNFGANKQPEQEPKPHNVFKAHIHITPPEDREEQLVQISWLMYGMESGLLSEIVDQVEKAVIARLKGGE